MTKPKLFSFCGGPRNPALQSIFSVQLVLPPLRFVAGHHRPFRLPKFDTALTPKGQMPAGYSAQVHVRAFMRSERSLCASSTCSPVFSMHQILRHIDYVRDALQYCCRRNSSLPRSVRAVPPSDGPAGAAPVFALPGKGGLHHHLFEGQKRLQKHRLLDRNNLRGRDLKQRENAGMGRMNVAIVSAETSGCYCF